MNDKSTALTSTHRPSGATPTAPALVAVTRRRLAMDALDGSVAVLRTRSEQSRKLASEVDNGLRAHGIGCTVITLPTAAWRLRLAPSTGVLVDATLDDLLPVAQLAALVGRPIAVTVTDVTQPTLYVSRTNLFASCHSRDHVTVLEDIATQRLVLRGNPESVGTLTTPEGTGLSLSEEVGTRRVSLHECTLTLDCDRSLVRIELETGGSRYQWWTCYVELDLNDGFDLQCDGADPKPARGSFTVSRLDALTRH